MATKVRELPKVMSLPAGSSRRRPDRVYEDQLWRWALAHPGHDPHDPNCCRKEA